MYTKEHLLKYPYFEQLIKSGDISNVLDSLTGLISRQHIIGFIQSLVDSRVPFSMALLDLDNFKFINDTYGHKIGDGVLAGVSSDLQQYLGDYAVAGRYGGDEFLIVNFRDLSYDEIKVFFAGLYSDYRVLRKNILLDDYEPFITGTIGSAVFPRDAQDYASLFTQVDKRSTEAKPRAGTATSSMWRKSTRTSPCRPWPAGASTTSSTICPAGLIPRLRCPIS